MTDLSPIPRRGRAPRAGGRTVLLASVVAAGVAALVFDNLASSTSRLAPTAAHIQGKSAERLGFVGDGPLQPVRVQDSLAMFALPQADSRSWTERPAPSPPGAVGTPETAPIRTAATPRIVAAEAEASRRQPSLPPSRPTRLAVAPATPPLAAPAGPVAEPARSPVRLLGVAVPGTEYLPTGREVSRKAAAFGDTAASLGGRAADAVTGTASRIGGTVSAFGARWQRRSAGAESRTGGPPGRPQPSSALNSS